MSEELYKDRSSFDAMASQQLEDILRADAEGTENLDTDSLIYIMELLAARQADEGRSAEEAYTEFRAEYLSRQKKRSGNSRLLLAMEAAAAVAAVIFFGILISNAIGINLWSILPGQTEDPQKPSGVSLENVAWAETVILDAEGNITGTGMVTVGRYSVTASVVPTGTSADKYDYTVSVDYTYFTEESRNPKDFQGTVYTNVELNENGITMSPAGQISNIRSATVTFFATEKGNGGSASSETVTVVGPFEQ